MNNSDKYQKIPLTPSIAEKVIIELFAGKDAVSRQDIIRKATAHYMHNGGLVPRGNPVSLFKEALDGLKRAGRARNLHGGYWAENVHGGYWIILPVHSDSSEEILFSDPEIEAEGVDGIGEEILFEVKAESVEDVGEEILFSEPEVKAEGVEDLVESLLGLIKAEINNLDEGIEVLKRRKSHLEENLTQFTKVWQNAENQE